MLYASPIGCSRFELLLPAYQTGFLAIGRTSRAPGRIRTAIHCLQGSSPAVRRQRHHRGYRFYRPVRSQSGFLRNPIAPASRVWSITLPAVNYSSSGNNNRYPFFFPSSFCYNCLPLLRSDRVPVRSECYIILFSKPVTGIEPVSTAWKAAMRSEFLTEF